LDRAIIEFKGYQSRTLGKNENGNLFTYSHNILNRWKNYLSAIK